MDAYLFAKKHKDKQVQKKKVKIDTKMALGLVALMVKREVLIYTDNPSVLPMPGCSLF